jgi:exodeoxyribonuclease V gamma subunit
VCIGRAKRVARPRSESLGSPEASAIELLGDLVALYDLGRREPLPLPLKTSYAWAEARHSGGDPVYAAGNRWRTNNFPGEDAHPPHARVWGSGAPLERLMQPLRPDEEYPGEDNRLGAFAARLWLPMLRAGQAGR